MILAGALGALGLVCLITKRTVVGVLVGTQLVAMGAAVSVVCAGISAGKRADSQVLALFITVLGLVTLVSGYSFAIRLYYLRRRVGIRALRRLRH